MVSQACSLVEARKKVFANLDIMTTEIVSLDDALFRTLRENLIAPFTLPLYPQSTMDGYAISSLDRQTFHIIKEIPTGSDSPQICLQADETVQVFTGSILPKNTEAVVPIENITLANQNIVVHQKPTLQQFILAKGSDFTKGATLIECPKRLTPRDLALIASLGKANVVVSRRPKVYVISTGSELILPGMPLTHGKIYASNGYAIKGLCKASGGDVRLLPLVPDDARHLEQLVRLALSEADLVVTIGGASVGKYDLVKSVLKRQKAEFAFERVNTRPGRPIFFARTETCPVLGLPGNPASASVGSWLYLADMIKKCTGLEVDAHISFKIGRIQASIPANNSKFDIFHRASIRKPTDQEVELVPLKRQESGLNYPTALADVLIHQKPYEDALVSATSVAYFAPAGTSL